MNSYFNAARRNNRKAFTLTELAVVLGIIGIIIGAIWTAAKSVSDSGSANQAAQDITTISQNIRSAYTGSNSFTAAGDQTGSLITMGSIIPANLVVVPATVPPTAKNQWNGAVQVFFAPTPPYTLATNPRVDRVFRIIYKNTPQDACVRIASQLVNAGTQDGPIGMLTNGGNYTGVPNTGLLSSIVSTLCANNVGSPTASTEFDFKIH